MIRVHKAVDIKFLTHGNLLPLQPLQSRTFPPFSYKRADLQLKSK